MSADTVEFLTYVTLRKQIKTLDELLIMATVRCRGFGLDGKHQEVHTGHFAHNLLGNYVCFYYSMKDVCQFLRFSKYRDALKRIPPDLRKIFPVETSGGIKPMIFVTTRGVEELIRKSRRPEVKQ